MPDVLKNFSPKMKLLNANNYRPVIINFDVEGDKRGLFHGWFNQIADYPGAGIDSKLCGIIELSSGETVLLSANDFKFNDSEFHFNNFYWNENGNQAKKV